MELQTSHGCRVIADIDFGMVQINVAHFPAHTSLSLPLKDALLLADMIYTLAGADEKTNYKEAA